MSEQQQEPKAATAEQDPRRRIMEELLTGYKATDLKFRPGHKNRQGEFRVYPYIDKHAIMERLDKVLGHCDWRVSYAALLNDGTLCTLALRIGGEWLEKQGVGGQKKMESQQDSIKSGATDAFRQAADAWGFGRFLSRFPALFWPGELTQKQTFSYWKNEGALVAHFAALLEGKKPPARPQRDQQQTGEQQTGQTKTAAAPAADKEDKDAARRALGSKPAPPAATNTGKTAAPPPAKQQTAKIDRLEKPANPIASSSVLLMKPPLRNTLSMLAVTLGADIDLLSQQEFACSVDDLTQEAGAYLHCGLKQGWLKLNVVEIPADLLAARETMTPLERAAFNFFALGQVRKEGDRYFVGRVSVSQVWRSANTVIQCDCSEPRQTNDDPECAHVKAVKFYTGAAKAKAQPAQATANA